MALFPSSVGQAYGDGGYNYGQSLRVKCTKCQIQATAVTSGTPQVVYTPKTTEVLLGWAIDPQESINFVHASGTAGVGTINVNSAPCSSTVTATALPASVTLLATASISPTVPVYLGFTGSEVFSSGVLTFYLLTAPIEIHQ